MLGVSTALGLAMLVAYPAERLAARVHLASAELLLGLPGSEEKAVDRCTQALRLTPDDPVAHVLRGRAHAGLGKHAAAVAYVLGEAFDADPFLMFRMRGMDRDELLAGLGPAPAKPAAAVLPEKGEPLSVDLAAFWGREGEVEAAPRIAASEGDLVHKLGAMPFWRAAEALEVVVARAQKRVSKCALELLGGGGAAEAEVVVPVRKGRKKGSRHPPQ